jgi:hypothetical protein
MYYNLLYSVLEIIKIEPQMFESIVSELPRLILSYYFLSEIVKCKFDSFKFQFGLLFGVRRDRH